MARAKTKTTRNALTYETLPALFTGICDAVRGKDGTAAQINHQDIPARISALPSGGSIEMSDFNASANSETFWKARNYTVIEDGTYYMVVTATADTTATGVVQPRMTDPYSGTAIPLTKGVCASGVTNAYYEMNLHVGDKITFGAANAQLYKNSMVIIWK